MKISPYKIDEFIKNIDQNKNISSILIFGSESGLVSIRSKEITKKIIQDNSDPFAINNISSKQIEENGNILFDEFFSTSIFGTNKKLIKINPATNKITKNLKAVLEVESTSDNFILLIANELDTSSSLRKFAEKSPKIAVIACYEDNIATISRIIREKFLENKINIESGVIEYINSKFGKNRLIILNEIEKIISYLDGQKNLTLKITQNLLSDISEVSINEFVNYFVALNLQKSITILDQIYYQKISPIVIIRYLQNYFFKLYKISAAITAGSNLETEMKIQRIFFKEQDFCRQHHQIWQIPSIEKMITKLQEVEIKCKKDYENCQNIFNSFVNMTYLMKKSGKI
jgi:DNA polymerase III delta subunit